MVDMRRREFIGAVAAVGTLAGAPGVAARSKASGRIGVTPVSFRDWFAKTPAAYRSGRPQTRSMALERFPAFVSQELGLKQIELWSMFFDELTPAYCERLKRAVHDAGVSVGNIQLDGIGADLASLDDAERAQALATVKAWIDRAKVIGASRVRANTDQPVAGRPFDPDRIAESFRELAEHGASAGVTVLIENHTGYSKSIANVMTVYERVKQPRCKLLADWGNSEAETTEARIADLSAMFPALDFVSAKGVAFDRDYRHTAYDIGAIVRATEASGYKGCYSVELFAMGAAMPEDPARAVRTMADTIRANLGS